LDDPISVLLFRSFQEFSPLTLCLSGQLLCIRLLPAFYIISSGPSRPNPHPATSSPSGHSRNDRVANHSHWSTQALILPRHCHTTVLACLRDCNPASTRLCAETHILSILLALAASVRWSTRLVLRLFRRHSHIVRSLFASPLPPNLSAPGVGHCDKKASRVLCSCSTLHVSSLLASSTSLYPLLSIFLYLT
jgi:hypothetical protein